MILSNKFYCISDSDSNNIFSKKKLPCMIVWVNNAFVPNCDQIKPGASNPVGFFQAEICSNFNWAQILTVKVVFSAFIKAPRA